jgi:hypothetical protein
MNLMGIVMLSAGAVLMYAAYTDHTPQEVIKNALAGKPTPKRTVTTDPNTGRRSGSGTFSSTPTPTDGTRVLSV